MNIPIIQNLNQKRSYPGNVFRNFLSGFSSLGIKSVKGVNLRDQDIKIEKISCQDTLDNPWLP